MKSADSGFDRRQSQIELDLETTVDAVAAGLASGTIRVIDVREPDEWAEGHIAGSVLIPMSELAERVQEIDPKESIVTVCRVGARSIYVAEALLEAGYPRVQSMAGGINAWVMFGQSLEV